MNEEEQYLHAAKKIREDPELPGELAPKLDKLLEAAADTEGDERAAAVGELVGGLRRHKWTSRRLDELALGSEGVAVTWTDGQLAGEDAVTWTDGQLAGGDSDTPKDPRPALPPLELKCRASKCGFTNKLAFRPPEDDMPECQNPKIAAHTLVL